MSSPNLRQPRIQQEIGSDSESYLETDRADNLLNVGTDDKRHRRLLALSKDCRGQSWEHPAVDTCTTIASEIL